MASPLNTSTAVIAADMITCGAGSWSTNPATNDIAAPAELSGSHFVTTKCALSTTTTAIVSPPR